MANKLTIPRKNFRPKTADLSQEDADINWRAIEQWANSLSFAGVSVGGFGYEMGAASTGAEAVWYGSQSFFGAATPQTTFPIFGGNVGYPPANFITATIVFAVFGGGFFWVPAAAGTKIIAGFSSFLAPQFTGPTSTIQASVNIAVVEVNGVAPAANSFLVHSHTISIASGLSHTLTATDYAGATINGADLTFTGGIVRSVGGAIPYLCSWDVLVQWDTANTYAHL